MTAPLQVGQFAIVDHEPVDRGPNAGVFHGKGPTDDRAELYIVAEGTTPAGEAFAGHVVSAVGQTWGTLDMSLTGSLRAVFSEAERNLRDWNRKSIAQHRVSIGMTCFGRRGEQAVIAQGGPSVALHLSEGNVTAYFTDEEHGRPVGAGPVSPQLTRIPFRPGDRLLLISTSALRELDEEILGGIVALPVDQVLQDLYHRLEGVRHLTAVLISDLAGASPGGDGGGESGGDEDSGFVIGADFAAPAPATPQPPGGVATEVFQPSLFIAERSEETLFSARRHMLELSPRARVEAMAPSIAAEIPEPLRRASGESPLARLAAERQARASLSRAAAMPSALGGADVRNDRRGTGGEGPPGERRRRKDSFSRGLVREELPPPPQPNFEDIPLVHEMADDYRARPAPMGPISETIAGDNSASIQGGGSLVRVRSSMGGRWRGHGGLSRRRSVPGSLPPTWLVIVVGLGILLALVGFIVVPRMLDAESGKRYAELVDGAQQRLSTALVQQDAAERRKLLTEAQAMLLEAKDARADAPELVNLLARVGGEIATMDAIKAPASVAVIASLEQFGDKPVAASRLVIGIDQAYILDAASGQVIAITFATGEKKVIYAEDKAARQGRPLAATFLDAGDLAGSLLVVDAARNLWVYSRTAGIRQAAFNAPGNLNVTDITAFGRDLYVLDAGASAIFRFPQGDAGFTSPPTRALETPDLAAARRLMMDGEFVTSDANGTIHRFRGANFSLVLAGAGIDKRLIAPEQPQALVPNGELAILDAPNERIVVFRRDGVFDRQYRHKDFQSMSAFAIRDGAAYIFSGGKLRRVTW